MDSNQYITHHFNSTKYLQHFFFNEFYQHFIRTSFSFSLSSDTIYKKNSLGVGWMAQWMNEWKSISCLLHENNNNWFYESFRSLLFFFFSLVAALLKRKSLSKCPYFVANSRRSHVLAKFNVNNNVYIDIYVIMCVCVCVYIAIRNYGRKKTTTKSNLVQYYSFICLICFI